MILAFTAFSAGQSGLLYNMRTASVGRHFDELLHINESANLIRKHIFTKYSPNIKISVKQRIMTFIFTFCNAGDDVNHTELKKVYHRSLDNGGCRNYLSAGITPLHPNTPKNIAHFRPFWSRCEMFSTISLPPKHIVTSKYIYYLILHFCYQKSCEKYYVSSKRYSKMRFSF